MKAPLIFLILCSGIFPLYSQDLDAVKKDSLQSEVLNETRSFQLYLPPSYHKYKTSKHYPVILVLDGERLFDVTRSQVHFLSQTAKIPEAIVVGISNTNRTRDFTPTSTTIGYTGEPDEGLNESYLSDSNLQTVIYDGDSHGTVPLRSILDGLEFIFRGYFVEGMKYRPTAEFIQSFAVFEQQMGHDFPPLEELVSWLGLRKTKEESYEEGLLLLEMNAENYPDSWLTLYHLAATYEKMGEVKQAEQYYLKAQAVAPDNPDLMEKLNNRE